MELWKSKRKIVIATSVLLAVMLMLTLISKSVYAYQLPQITVEEARKRTVGRQINLPGVVSQSREYAVSTLPSVRVNTVEVGRGDEIKEGSLLFTLDMADLKEQIAARELAIQKLQVQIAALQHNQGLADRKKEQNTDRALEDYVESVSDNDVLLGRALTKEEQAKQDLQKHLEDSPEITRNSDREAAQEEYEQWMERGKALKREVEELTKKLADAQAAVDQAQTEYDRAKAGEGALYAADMVKTEASEGTQETQAVEKPPSAEGISAAQPQPSEEASEAEQPVSEEDTVWQPTTEESSASGGQPSAEETSSKEQPSVEESCSKEQPSAEEPCSKEQPASEETSAAEPSASEMPPAEETQTRTEDSGSSSELEQLEKRLEEAQRVRDDYQEALEESREKLEEYQSEGRTKPDFSAEDAEKKSWEAQKETLQRSVENAQWDYDDSLRQKRKAMEEAQRKVDDAAAPEDIQDTLALCRLELEYDQEMLTRYRRLQKEGGQVTAPGGGIVTGVHVSSGNDTPDGAAVVYAAKEADLKFQTSLTKDEKKYISQGTEGELLLGTESFRLTVDYMEQQADGSYGTEILLPEGVGKMGESGTFSVNYQSRSYSQCIPVNALYEENSRHYIYVVRRQQGILGEELAAEKRFVTVQEKGDSYAALSDGTLAEGEEVILTSTKQLSDGTVVRYRLSDPKD